MRFKSLRPLFGRNRRTIFVHFTLAFRTGIHLFAFNAFSSENAHFLLCFPAPIVHTKYTERKRILYDGYLNAV